MLLIQQQKLHFKDEKSDKVYEVELYHIQDDEYIVNFRYGRRDKRLTEGTKTVFPVSQEQANKVYNDLIDSKVKKGYQRVQDYGFTQIQPTAIPDISLVTSGAIPVVLSYLKKRSEGQVLTTNWKLSRIIWRAGELRIEEAVTYIKHLLPSLQGQEIYSAVWTLGRIANAEAEEVLKNMSVRDTDLSYNIYIGGLINAGDKTKKEKALNRLPTQLSALYTVGKYEDYVSTLRDYLFVMQSKKASFLIDSYYLTIHNDKFREAFVPLLRDIKLEPGTWKYIRYIYKVAEMIEDGDTFGMITSRVNIRPAFYQKPWGEYMRLGSQDIKLKDELASSNSRIAFSNKTRAYFIKRSLKRLVKAGYDKQESYCKFASGILIAYTEEDLRPHYSENNYKYNQELRSYENTIREFTTSAHIPYFYYILYGQGDRFAIKKTSKFYHEGGVKPATQREDSFQHLWDAYPQYAVKVLANCRVREVMDFALDYLENRSNLDHLMTADILIKMIHHPFPEVLEYSLQFIEKKYNPTQPDVELIIALIDSGNDKAIETAIRLIDKNKAPFTKHISFVKKSLQSYNKGIHTWLRENIKEENFSESETKDIVNETLESYFLIKEEEHNALSADSLIEIFNNHLSQLEAEKIIEMLDHPQLQIQLLGAKLININKRKPHEWPEEVLMKMLSSEHGVIRDEGMKMFAKLTDEELLKRDRFISSLAASRHADLRLNARPIIGRLAPIGKDFSEKVFFRLYNVLLLDHEDEQLPIDVYVTIEAHLLEMTKHLGKDINTLLESDKREIHLLTHHYIDNYADLNQWPIDSIARMGGHDMKSLRDLSQEYYKENVDKIKFHKYEAIRILDTDWEDTRIFGMDLFDTHFSEKEWEPGLIVALCDSIRLETQDYGIKILGQYFKDENGIKYLTALSEHPDKTIQIYTTNYLDRYALNNMDMLAKLKPYFKRILSSVNTKRVAKLRVFGFLDKQAHEGENQAKYVSEILNEMIGTIAVRENENYVCLLRDIELKYTDIDTDIEILPLEIRS